MNNTEKDSSEYIEAYASATQFKKSCSKFIHQKFY